MLCINNFCGAFYKFEVAVFKIKEITMDNIKEIVSRLDAYLEKNRMKTIGPVEANEILAKAGILKDSMSRPGLPLRRFTSARIST